MSRVLAGLFAGRSLTAIISFPLFKKRLYLLRKDTLGKGGQDADYMYSLGKGRLWGFRHWVNPVVEIDPVVPQGYPAKTSEAALLPTSDIYSEGSVT